MGGGWRGLLLIVRFLSELAMLGALVVVGIRAADGAAAVALAVALPLAAATVWGLVVAPKARRRLDDPARLVVEFVLFAVTGVALVAVGLGVVAAVFVVVAAGSALLVRRYSAGS